MRRSRFCFHRRAIQTLLIGGLLIAAGPLAAQPRSHSASPQVSGSSTRSASGYDTHGASARTYDDVSTTSDGRRPVYTASQRSVLKRSSSRMYYVPSHQKATEGIVVDEPPMEVIESPLAHGPVAQGPIGGCYGSPGYSCGIPDCQRCFARRPCWWSACLIPWPMIDFRNVQYFAGAQGFINPRYNGAPDRGQDGSFGFHQGVNWGFPVPLLPRGAFSAQLGAQVLESNFSGASFTAENRYQYFVTGGVFRRVDWGLQGGVVIDYMYDDWYIEMELAQLRGELSWVFAKNHEIGGWFTASSDPDNQQGTIASGGSLVTVQESWEPIDTYSLFYRYRSTEPNGGEGRIFAGLSAESDALVGADVLLPVTEQWAFQCGFTYLIPEELNHEPHGSINEVWNLAFSLVWYPAGFGNCPRNYHRPLMNVAGNGTFFIDRRSQP